MDLKYKYVDLAELKNPKNQYVCLRNIWVIVFEGKALFTCRKFGNMHLLYRHNQRQAELLAQLINKHNWHNDQKVESVWVDCAYVPQVK